MATTGTLQTRVLVKGIDNSQLQKEFVANPPDVPAYPAHLEIAIEAFAETVCSK
jgi:hypothetical protein